MLNDLPTELTFGRRFVCWQYQERYGKKTKVPISPNGGLAKVNDPKTWASFDEAISQCERKNLSGIGIVLSQNGDLVGIDLDDCIDDVGNWTPEAREIIETVNSYSETTPSNKGARIFARGKLPMGARRRGKIEIYDEGRYLTLTGNHVAGTPKTVEARQHELIKVWQKYVAPHAPIREQRINGGPDMPQDELLQKAMDASNGPTFRELYDGGLAGYPSASEGDLVFCSLLAFWTKNNADRIDAIFRGSKRYRPKWDNVHVQGRSYGEETIRKAIAGTTETYQGKRDRQGPEHVLIDLPTKDADILSLLFKWDDIASMDVSTEWLLDKLIPKGAITLVFCPGGGGKTWLLMQLSKSIATGEFFGDLKTVQCPVYFIDFENPLSVVKERREKIGPAPGFYYWHLACPTGPRKLDEEAWTDYKALPPGLLIFDTLRASHGGDENSSKDMALVLSRLKELREVGLTIVVLHHTPKGNDGTYKGSTAILDLADHVLSLERQGKTEDDEFDTDSTFKFGCRIKTRFEPHSVFLSFDPARGFSMKDDPDNETMKLMANILKREGRPLMQKEFIKLLEEKLEMKKGRVRKFLKKGAGVFWKVERGEKDNALLYSGLLSGFSVFPLTKVAENQKTTFDGFRGNENTNDVNDTKDFDNYGFSGFSENDGKTEKVDDEFVPEIDDEIPDVEGEVWRF